MLTDQELQSLRNLGNEAEAAADEIEQLRGQHTDSLLAVIAAQDAELTQLRAELAAERERCAKAAAAFEREEARADAAEVRAETAQAAERERCLNEWNGLLLELRQMADDSADRGDVFAQRVVALLSRA